MTAAQSNPSTVGASGTGGSGASQLLPLIPDFLRAIESGLALIPGWPAVAGMVLTTGAALIERGEAAAGELATLASDVQAMVTTGTAPTPEQLTSLYSRSNAAHDALQSSTAAPPAGSPP